MAEATPVLRLFANTKSASANWEQEVIAQAASIRSRILIAGLDAEAKQGVLDCVRKAEEVLREGPKYFQFRRRIVDWWNGGRVEQSWSFLHEGDLLLLEKASNEYICTRGLDDARYRANGLDQFNPVRRRFLEASQERYAESSKQGNESKSDTGQPPESDPGPDPGPAPTDGA